MAFTSLSYLVPNTFLRKPNIVSFHKMGDPNRRGLKNTSQDKLLNALVDSTFNEASHIIPTQFLCQNGIGVQEMGWSFKYTASYD